MNEGVKNITVRAITFYLTFYACVNLQHESRSKVFYFESFFWNYDEQNIFQTDDEKREK